MSTAGLRPGVVFAIEEAWLAWIALVEFRAGREVALDDSFDAFAEGLTVDEYLKELESVS